MRIIRQTGWAGIATFFSAAVMAAGMSFVTAPAQAAFELPEGEKITNVPAIPRAIPQKEAYELYDPKIGKNFDIKNFWIRADLRVRPEFRTGICFGGGGDAATGGACNTFNGNANGGHSLNQQYVQQMTRLGIGYDLSPDVNFYMELIQSSIWGANGAPGSTGGNIDALNHNGGRLLDGGNGNCGVLGVRAAYMLVRNFAGIQGFSVKAGRQYIVFGNHSLFGHFDWANTGFSHDGIMLQYSTKSFDSYLGWFRTSNGDLGQAAPTGNTGTNAANGGVGGAAGQPQANANGDMIIFYNQIKSLPGFLVEPYYILYMNGAPSNALAAQTLGTPKSQNQTRNTIGNRIEMRKGNFDAINELVYQFGAMGGSPTGGNANSAAVGNQKDIHINAFATRNWLGYTHYQSAWKPRLAFNFDYATGDGRANCTLAGSVQAVRRAIRLKTCSRQTTSTWATWMSRPGRT